MELISRETLIDSLYSCEELKGRKTIEAVAKTIMEQPPVEVPQWIPCSDRLPQSEDKYGLIKCNVTVMRSHYPTSTYDYCDSPYEEYFVAGAIYDVSQKIWHIGEHTQLNALIDIEDSPLNGDCVIAWMPLPEPYKAEQT